MHTADPKQNKNLYWKKKRKQCFIFLQS